MLRFPRTMLELCRFIQNYVKQLKVLAITFNSNVIINNKFYSAIINNASDIHVLSD